MSLSEQLFRARLNYQDIKERNPEWDNVMINDYLGIGLGSSIVVEQIDQNTVDISINSESIEENSEQIGQIMLRLGSILSTLSENSANIASNEQSIALNSAGIGSNTDRISDIEELVNRV